MLHIVERYMTVGGEAPIAGSPVYIIRFSGCNLSCFYCDTKYNSEKNEELTERKLRDIITKESSEYPGLKILFTGGEPLLHDRQTILIKIISSLPETQFYIETNGSFPVSIDAPENCHFIADCKSPSSGEEDKFCIENLRLLNPERDCLKFVVNRDDLSWLLTRVRFIRKQSPNLPLYASPQWENLKFRELTEFIIHHKLDLNLSLQIHKIIWPPETRRV